MRGGRSISFAGICRALSVLLVVIISITSVSPLAFADDGPTIILKSDLVMDVPPGTPVSINVSVIGTQVSSVFLHWRFSGAFHNDSMTLVGNNLWSATIPGQSDYGVISYYITAADSSGNESRFPKSSNLTLWVVDTVPPVISFDNTTLPSFKVGEATNLTVQASDNNNLSYVAFYYRYEGDVEWHSEGMTAAGNSYYLNFVPKKSGPMEFYFSAFDGRQHAYYPSAGASAPIEVRVSSTGLFGLSLTVTLLMFIAIALLIVDIVFYMKKKRR